MTERQLGYVPVDSGQLLIVDPCYLIDRKRKDHAGMTEAKYTELCDPSADNAPCLLADRYGTGIKLADFGGDGRYPVVGRFNERGGLVSVVISFK